MDSEPWLTKREIAAALKISIKTVERHKLPHTRVGGQNRYKMSEVEVFLKGQLPLAPVIPLRPDREDGAA